MEPSNEGSTFLKVDEVGEAPAPADRLDENGGAITANDMWTAEVGQNNSTGSLPDAAADSAGPRPALRRDQWVPPPQQPAPSPPGVMEEPETATDSISLAQLRKIVVDMPRKEPTPYAFEYKDRSSFEEELEELFGYSQVERELLLHLPVVYEHNCKAFFREAMQEDNTSDDDVEVRHVKYLSTLLASGNSDARDEALQVLLYMALGCWKDTAMQRETDLSHSEGARFEEQVDVHYTKPAVQVRKIKANIGLIARVVGFETLSACFRDACQTHATHPESEQADAAKDAAKFDRDAMAHFRTGFWASSKLLALVVDFARRCSEIDDNLELRKVCIGSSLKLLGFMTELIADWRWEERGILPPTTILTLHWKLIQLAFGDLQDVHNIKQKWNQDRDLERDDSRPFITASPLDYHLFRQEITSKYPAFDPPPPLFPFEPESTSYFPPAQEQIHRLASENKLASSVPGGINASGSSIIHQPVHISTPAPSPPPSPAGPGGKGIKKQNYQTNQMFPFLYPPLEENSNAIGGKGSTELQDALAGRKWTGSHIPASILEAADLFSQRMRATRAMKQLWDERVRFMKYERGYDPLRLPPSWTEDSDDTKQKVEPKADPMLDALSARQRERMGRVDAFYAGQAPNLQSFVVVLLKVTLQAVTTLVTQPNLQNSASATDLPRTQSNGDLVAEQEDQSLSILQNLDLMRSQEIMGKAVSGILLLLLKWFKLSHVLKFEYLTQLLMDSNYAQLTLKMFTYQDLERVVNFKCERKGLNFFEFCHQHALGAKIGPTEEDDENDAEPPPIRTSRNTNGDSLDEVPASVTQVHPPETDELGSGAGAQPVETITEYSWRNFFTNINHLRILQKLVKNKVHRQLIMVQLKFSNILKKALKVPQPEIRIYTLKIIKGQVPYCHRKWRQSNMRVITAIYLHCKPELRDDWLAGLAVEEEMSEALPQEQALRSLTYWYNLRTYPDAMGSDKDKTNGLLEEEQDFFVRELETMEAAMGGLSAADSFDGDDGFVDYAPRADGAAAPVEGW